MVKTYVKPLTIDQQERILRFGRKKMCIRDRHEPLLDASNISNSLMKSPEKPNPHVDCQEWVWSNQLLQLTAPPLLTLRALAKDVYKRQV